MPAVSIITAAYKQDHYLAEALQSALRQSIADFELLVCDDANLPSTAELVESFNDRRLRYLPNPTNLGVAANHLAGFDRATAPFVAVLNQDDRWTPEMLSTLLPPLQSRPTLAIAFSDHWLMDQHGQRLAEQTEANTRLYARDRLAPGLCVDPAGLLLGQSIPTVMAAVFRRSALDTLDRELFLAAGPAYDFALAAHLAFAGEVWYEPARLSEYRTHPESLTTGSSIAWFLGEARVWQSLMAANLPAGHRRAVRRRLAESCRIAAVRSARQGQPGACALAARALRYAPGPRTLLSLLWTLLPRPLRKG